MLNHRDPKWLEHAKALTGWDTASLARAADVSRDTLERIAKGASPTIRTFSKIEDAVRAAIEQRAA